MGVNLVLRTEEIKQKLRARVAVGLNEAGQFFVDEAQTNANIKTGFMMTHIGMTVPATPETLFCEVRSLAPYSKPQNDGRYGNLFWTRAWLETRRNFQSFFMVDRGSAGSGIIKSAMQEFQHNVTDRGLRVTKARAFGGGFVMRNVRTGKFAGSYGRRVR